MASPTKKQIVEDVNLNALVPAEMAEALKAQAAAEDRSLSSLVRLILSDYLKERRA